MVIIFIIADNSIIFIGFNQNNLNKLNMKFIKKIQVFSVDDEKVYNLIRNIKNITGTCSGYYK